MLKAGFDNNSPTAWLAEGLMIYLSSAEADRLLTMITSHSTSGSRLSFEHQAGDPRLPQAQTMPTLQKYTALWKGGLGEDAAGWLADHGWRPRHHDITTLAASYGRPPEATGGFLTALRM